MNESRRIYVNAAAQISIQQPLSDLWMNEPLSHEKGMCRAVEPDYKAYISPVEARRMGRLLKMSLTTALDCIRHRTVFLQSDADFVPSAIICGSGLGCMEHSESVLRSVCAGEEGVKPTAFMQSTHNTLASAIAIKTANHGYNATYSHLGLSFESALADAFTQLKSAALDSALVASYDELTQDSYALMRKIGYISDEMFCPASEVAASFVLSDQKAGALCSVAAVRTYWRVSAELIREDLDRILESEGLEMSDISCVLCGCNGNMRNDTVYDDYLSVISPDIPRVSYKKLFGESLSSSAMAFYTAATLIGEDRFPQTLPVDSPLAGIPDNVLIFNQQRAKEFSLVFLRRC